MVLAVMSINKLTIYRSLITMYHEIKIPTHSCHESAKVKILGGTSCIRYYVFDKFIFIPYVQWQSIHNICLFLFWQMCALLITHVWVESSGYNKLESLSKLPVPFKSVWPILPWMLPKSELHWKVVEWTILLRYGADSKFAFIIRIKYPLTNQSLLGGCYF